VRGRAAALAAALLIAAGLAGCGGGGDSGSTGASTASTSTPAAAGGSGEAGAKASVAPLRVSAGGSASFRVKGGDNSVPDYGSEAAASELAQAAKTLHAYMVARARGDWAKGCTYLSAEARESTEQPAPSGTGKGCAAGLAASSAGVSASAARELTVIDAASLRVEGPQGFLLYRGAGDTPFSMPMVREGSVWAVGLLLPSMLQAG
jgi:hypothetical protein